MTTTPVLTGRDIGITYQAIAAIRDRLLADVGMTFEDSIQLNVLADAPAATAPSSELVAVLAAGLKLCDDAASAAIDALVSRGLATRDDAGTVTATERAVDAHRRFTALVAELTPRLYGDIPSADLEAAKRVLDTVTGRANQQLAAGAEPLGEATSCDGAFVSTAEPAEQAKPELDRSERATSLLDPSSAA